MGGKELIERKVAELVVQGGDFSLNISDPRPHRAGYNLGTSLHCRLPLCAGLLMFSAVPATNLTAAKVLEVWPSPVTYLGGNIGRSVLTGAVLAKTPKYNPVRAGKPISIHLIAPDIPQSHSSHLVYDIYHNGTGIENGSWDLLAMYYGVLGISEGSFKYGNGDRGGQIEIYPNGTAAWNYGVVIPASRRQHFLE